MRLCASIRMRRPLRALGGISRSLGAGVEGPPQARQVAVREDERIPLRRREPARLAVLAAQHDGPRRGQPAAVDEDENLLAGYRTERPGVDQALHHRREPELLADLPDEALLGRFASLQAPAREFPLVALVEKQAGPAGVDEYRLDGDRQAVQFGFGHRRVHIEWAQEVLESTV